MSETTIVEFIGLETEEIEIKENGIIYIEETTYRVYNDGSKTIACSSRYPKSVDEPIVPEPTQLDRIESGVTTLLENGNVIDAMLGVTSYE